MEVRKFFMFRYDDLLKFKINKKFILEEYSRAKPQSKDTALLTAAFEFEFI